MDEKLLAIYLNDHLAVATAGVEASKRLAREQRGNAARRLPRRAA